MHLSVFRGKASHEGCSEGLLGSGLVGCFLSVEPSQNAEAKFGGGGRKPVVMGDVLESETSGQGTKSIVDVVRGGTLKLFKVGLAQKG